MGSSFTNLQVRSTDHDRVVGAMQEAEVLPAYVSTPSTSGWISVYPRTTEDQDEEGLKDIAKMLSEKLGTAAFGVLVHDSDIFMYFAAENGLLVDEYNSDPGYFDGKNVKPTGGDMDFLARFSQPEFSKADLVSTFSSKKENLLVGATKFMWHLARKDLGKAFSSTCIFRGDTLAGRFGEILSIESERISSGYKYIKSEGGSEGLTLLRNLKEEEERARGKGGPPELLSEMDAQAKMMSAEQREKYASFLGDRVIEYDVATGQALDWHGTVKNDGGYSKGLRLSLTGPALADGFFSELSAELVRWQASSEENDFESIDREDETFWPDYKVFQATAEPQLWMAEFPDFVYTTEMLVRLPVVPSRAGECQLDLKVSSLDPTALSAAKYSIKIKSGPPRQPAKQNKAAAAAAVTTMGPYKVNFPAGWDVNASEGGLGSMFGIVYSLRGFKERAGGDNRDATQLDISVNKLEDDDKEKAQALQDRIKWVRVTQQARNFEVGPISRTTLAGFEMELASWQAADKKVFGICAIGRKGAEELVINGSTHSKAELEELRQIGLSLH